MRKYLSKIKQNIINCLMYESENSKSIPICDFDRLRYEIRPCDVLLIEGKSRASEVIKQVTSSPWSHAALYVGRLHDIEEPSVREYASQFFHGEHDTQLLVESELGKGTVITPIEHYETDHIRICRPQGISRQDAQSVISYALQRLGNQYDVRHIFDLLRLLLPWSIFPRRWRSCVFRRNPGTSTKEICSTMLADAFGSVRFPITPKIKRSMSATVTLSPRNPRLVTPNDFDYSPYFEIIKYPIYGVDIRASYRDLPWEDDALTLYSDAMKKQADNKGEQIDEQ